MRGNGQDEGHVAEHPYVPAQRGLVQVEEDQGGEEVDFDPIGEALGAAFNVASGFVGGVANRLGATFGSKPDTRLNLGPGQFSEYMTESEADERMERGEANVAITDRPVQSGSIASRRGVAGRGPARILGGGVATHHHMHA